MTIPMYKIERTTIKMNPDHGCRYKELTSALNNASSLIEAIWLLATFCPLTKISSISLNRMCRLMVSTLRPSACA